MACGQSCSLSKVTEGCDGTECMNLLYYALNISTVAVTTAVGSVIVSKQLAINGSHDSNYRNK